MVRRSATEILNDETHELYGQLPNEHVNRSGLTRTDDIDEYKFERHLIDIKRMFGGKEQFSICIDSNKMDDVLCYKSAFIEYECKCCNDDGCSKIKMEVEPRRGKITVRDVIKKMIDNNYNPQCDHRYLEAITYRNGEILLWFGS